MPLENATYINDLVSTNPVATDQMGQGYQHLTLIKAVLKAQFPNWTSAKLNSTQAQIDTLTGMLSPANYWTIPAGTIAGDGGHVVLKAATSFTDIQVLNSSGSFLVFGRCGWHGWRRLRPLRACSPPTGSSRVPRTRHRSRGSVRYASTAGHWPRSRPAGTSVTAPTGPLTSA
jgi:hypothetical protein